MRKIFLVLNLCFALTWAYTGNAAEPTIYQLTVYHLQNSGQELKLDSFLANAYLPAVHKAGIKNVGVFKKIRGDKDSETLVYVLMSFQSLNAWNGLKAALAKDDKLRSTGSSFLNAAYDSLPYQRIETILLSAFPGTTGIHTPDLQKPRPERVYELRSYESPTEAYHVNKVQMFTAGGETGIFSRLGFNPIFYGSVLSGGHMPNLMYMTSFESMQERDRHWDTFGKDETWKTLSARPEYQHNVSRIDITFLHPTSYSDY